jgi:prepilin peptidase CpaA
MPPPIDLARWAIAAALSLILAWAAASDVRARIIPNKAVLAVVALLVPWALAHWGVWIWLALLAGVIGLAVGIALYAMGVVGAGDAKLFAAVSLFVGLDRLPALAVATALIGGLVAIASLLARPRRALVMIAMQGKGDFGPGIPYGLAIAGGGFIVVWAGVLRLALPVVGAS